MTASQFYATLGQTILYFGYVYLKSTQTPITVLACSVPRRILQQTISPALLSLLVGFSVLINTKASRDSGDSGGKV